MHRLLSLVVVASAGAVNGFRLVAPCVQQPSKLRTLTPEAPTITRPLKLQTLTPDAPTITRPSDLPDSWVVPDTFTLPTPKTERAPFYRVTLFKSSDFDSKYAAQVIVKVVGLEDMRAEEIANQAATTGFAVVGEWVQEIAEMYADGMKAQSLVVDVSEVQ